MGSAGFLQGLAGQFGNLFSPARASGRDKSSRAAEDASTIDTAEDSYRFEQKVRKLLTRSAGKKGGSLHYIGIAKVRGHYGPRWTEMAERVHGVAHEAIKRRLGEHDLYAQHHDDGYIVVFADSLKEAAKLKCGLMAQEMSKRLFGSDDCAHLEMATIDIDKAGRITADALRMGQISDTIASHQKAAGATTEVDAPAQSGAAGRPTGRGTSGPASRATPSSGLGTDRAGTSAPTGTLNSVLSRARPEATTAASKASRSATSRPTTAPATSSSSGRAAGGAAPPDAASPTTPGAAVGATSSGPAAVVPSLTQSPAPERGRLAMAPKATESLSDGRLRFVYRPLWFIQRKVIMGYVCVPCRVSPENVVLFGGAAMPVSMASPENAALDRLTILRVVADLKDLITHDRKSVLVAPVHHLTVSNPNSRRILSDLFTDTSDELRSLIVFELMGVADDIGAKDLNWTMESLKPYSKAVFVRRRLESTSIPVLREAGIYGTGAEIGNYSAPERTIIPAMSRFVDIADQAGLATYIHGLRTVSLVSAAMGSGFDYIDGDPIAAIDEAPNCIFPFGLQNLYQSVMDHPA